MSTCLRRREFVAALCASELGTTVTPASGYTGLSKRRFCHWSNLRAHRTAKLQIFQRETRHERDEGKLRFYRMMSRTNDSSPIARVRSSPDMPSSFGD